MKVKLLTFIACLVVPFQLATADIKADFDSGLNADKVLANAMADGMNIADAVTQMITLQPKRMALIIAAAVKASPENAGRIVAAATSIQCNNADTAIIKNQCKSTIITAAIAAGADPTLITAATAAGSTSSRAITALALTPAPGAGGGVASPN